MDISMPTPVKKKIKVNKQTKQFKVSFFRAKLGWSLKHVAQNYLFISISFYLFYQNIVCQNFSFE